MTDNIYNFPSKEQKSNLDEALDSAEAYVCLVLGGDYPGVYLAGIDGVLDAIDILHAGMDVVLGMSEEFESE